MTELIIGVVVGAVITVLVLNNNPKLAAKLKTVSDIVEKKIEEKTSKDI